MCMHFHLLATTPPPPPHTHTHTRPVSGAAVAVLPSVSTSGVSSTTAYVIGGYNNCEPLDCPLSKYDGTGAFANKDMQSYTFQQGPNATVKTHYNNNATLRNMAATEGEWKYPLPQVPVAFLNETWFDGLGSHAASADAETDTIYVSGGRVTQNQSMNPYAKGGTM